MTRLLIQCQGSPALSFKMTQAKVDAILHHYLSYQYCVIPLTSDKDIYYINLATVSWICVTERAD